MPIGLDQKVDYRESVTVNHGANHSNTFTLTFEPVEGTIKVYDLSGTAINTAFTANGKVITLSGTDFDNVSLLAVEYQRVIRCFIGETGLSDSVIKNKLATVPDTDVAIYYSTNSNNLAWVYNPFKGAYQTKHVQFKSAEANNLVNTVRVIMGMRKDGTTNTTMHMHISDLKVEYDTYSPIWTQHPKEIYGKKYAMDEKGFTISSSTNQMFIDEDEIKALNIIHKGEGAQQTPVIDEENPVFQIAGTETTLRTTTIQDDLRISRMPGPGEKKETIPPFTMAQEQINSEWYFLFY